jgi:hypothetical protein
MSVQTDPEDIERIRARIRGMSDSALLRYGQAARHMADQNNDPNPAFQVHLNEARTEWRRRHPTLPLSASL